MNKAILLHGTCDEAEYFDPQFPSLSNSHWFPWLQKQLLIKRISTQAPEMPNAYLPDYSIWKTELERFTMDSSTLLIGHSCGAGFLLRWLTEKKINCKKLILVAPWMDPYREQTTDFFDFTIDEHIINRVEEMHLVYSEDDSVQGVKETVELVKRNFPNIKIHKFQNKGHFTFGEMQSVEFPELLEIILKGLA